MVGPACTGLRLTAIRETHVTAKHNYMLTGPQVRQLMRKHKITIREFAKKFNLTLKRIRTVRVKGVNGFAASEWHYLITGVWLDLASDEQGQPSDQPADAAVSTPISLICRRH